MVNAYNCMYIKHISYSCRYHSLRLHFRLYKSFWHFKNSCAFPNHIYFLLIGIKDWISCHRSFASLCLRLYLPSAVSHFALILRYHSMIGDLLNCFLGGKIMDIIDPCDEQEQSLVGVSHFLGRQACKVLLAQYSFFKVWYHYKSVANGFLLVILHVKSDVYGLKDLCQKIKY